MDCGGGGGVNGGSPNKVRFRVKKKKGGGIYSIIISLDNSDFQLTVELSFGQNEIASLKAFLPCTSYT